MQCIDKHLTKKQIIRRIVDFASMNMPDKEASDFAEHLDKCNFCMQEVLNQSAASTVFTIHFLHKKLVAAFEAEEWDNVLDFAIKLRTLGYNEEAYPIKNMVQSARRSKHEAERQKQDKFKFTLYKDGKKVKEIVGRDHFKVPVSGSGKYEIKDHDGDVVCEKVIDFPDRKKASFDDIVDDQNYQKRRAAKRRFEPLEEMREYKGNKISFEFLIESDG